MTTNTGRRRPEGAAVIGLPQDFPTLATRKRAARELGFETEQSIDRLIGSGRLHAVKQGSRVYVTRDSIQRYLASLPAA